MSEHWDFFFANVNNKLASLFVDLGIRRSVPDIERPWLLWVWVYFNNPRDDGLHSAQEAGTLSQIEDSLNESVSGAVDGVLVGRITTDGRREFYFYAPSFAGFEDGVARGMKGFSDYRWDSGSKHDPEWEQYLGLLYPSPHDWQCIKNRYVIEQLRKAGDPLEKERLVFHWAYFPDESSRKQFVAAIRERGYEVTKQGRVDDPDRPHPFGVSFERVDRVDWDSINQVTIELFDLAESVGGDYDGWETSVEKQA